MSQYVEEELCGTTSSEDGEQESIDTVGWETYLIFYLVSSGVFTMLMWALWFLQRIEGGNTYSFGVQRRDRRGAPWLMKRLAICLLSWVACGTLGPIFMVFLVFPCLWNIPAAVVIGVRNVILERRTRHQANEATDTPRTANCHWHRRGWLVLLRARHQRIADAPVSSRGRWTVCCRKQNGLPMRVVSPSREEDIIESAQKSVAKDTAASASRRLLMRVVDHGGSVAKITAASGFRTLLMRVVDHEEDGVFRSIVGYL